jgi:SAM-dependent methyltransferase
VLRTLSLVAGTPSHRDDWLETNRAMWDERAAAHAESDYYDLDAVAAGRDDLRPWEDEELGPVAGRDLVHLQCHLGTDTVAWARRGARVVGLDFSAVALESAQTLSRRANLSVEWVHADVYDAAQALGGRTFDIVYTGFGALGWLPDLAKWADVVMDLVRPGGSVYVVELHPMWVALIEDGKTVCQDAIRTDFHRWDSPDEGSYAAPDVRFRNTATYERLHSIADVLTPLIELGFRIELFHEFDVTPAPTPWLVRRADGLYHFPEGAYRFPLVYSLLARRR